MIHSYFCRRPKVRTKVFHHLLSEHGSCAVSHRASRSGHGALWALLALQVRSASPAPLNIREPPAPITILSLNEASSDSELVSTHRCHPIPSPSPSLPLLFDTTAGIDITPPPCNRIGVRYPRSDVYITTANTAANCWFCNLTMSPVTRNRSLADMQHAEIMRTVPAEYRDTNYFREVLQLEDGRTEADYEERLNQEAEKLGITISRPPSLRNEHINHNSMCDSSTTVVSHHARTASSGSNGSASTGMTSRSSNEDLETSRKRGSIRRSMSFSEYEKYLAEHDTQETRFNVFPPPIPLEPAPSLFSVSTRKSYTSIKSGIKNKFRIRRNKSAQESIT